MSKRWKAVELGIAKLLGGERAGAVGKEGPDVLLELVAPEVKTREKLPKWFVDAMEQAEHNAPEGKVPFMIIHQKGWEYKDAIVGVRLGTMIELLNKLSLLGGNND
jgi:hypothetical protein